MSGTERIVACLLMAVLVRATVYQLFGFHLKSRITGSSKVVPRPIPLACNTYEIRVPHIQNYKWNLAFQESRILASFPFSPKLFKPSLIILKQTELVAKSTYMYSSSKPVVHQLLTGATPAKSGKAEVLR